MHLVRQNRIYRINKEEKEIEFGFVSAIGNYDQSDKYWQGRCL